jgi:hypothetical protein
MIVTFSEIINEILTLKNQTTDTIDASVLTSIKLRINQIQDYIFYYKAWEWRKRKYYFTSIAPYATGTITVTENSTSVTGSGTTFTDAMKRGFLEINNKRFRIQRIVSSTSLKLVAPYPDDTASGQSYKIVFPKYPVNPNLSSITSLVHEGRKLNIFDTHRQIKRSGVGIPQQALVGEREDTDFYTTGTVQVTLESASIVGTATAWDDSMLGMEFRVNEFGDAYYVKEVVGAAAITLDRPYKGTTGSGKTYTIGGVGSLLLELEDTPDDYYFMELEGLIKPVRLVSNNDVSLIPNHAPLLHGAVWLALIDAENKNPVRIQQARADFDRTLQELLDSYRVLNNTSWQSEAEIRAQQNGIVIPNQVYPFRED